MKTKISTSRHDASHLASPKGRGGWMFENAAGKHVFTFSGTYAEARKAAIAWGAANSIDTLYVCP
jgi:hypothetical protein